MNEHDLMLLSVLGCRRVDLYAKDIPISVVQQKRLDNMRRRRARGESLQYVLGETEFCGLSFQVDPRVLIPRPETEQMVEAVAQHIGGQMSHGPFHVLDIGTGSGCIAVSLAKKFSFLTCHAIDISCDALCVARKNAGIHAVDDRIVFECQDMKELWPQISSPVYDMIISNPPYIPTSALASLPADVQQEPRLALDGGEDGLEFFRDIVYHASCCVKPGGFVVCEFWDGQDVALNEMLDGFGAVEFFKDLSGVSRFVIAQKMLTSDK
jgi:release factor glutamine methyltransferase